MAEDFITVAKNDGLTLVLYRGEDMVLLAFDIDQTLQMPDFVGFGIQYRLGDTPDVREVYNGLTFAAQRPQVEALEKQIAASQSEDERKSLTAKKLELPVKRILLGARPEDVASRDALVEPGALDAFVAIARTRGVVVHFLFMRIERRFVLDIPVIELSFVFRLRMDVVS